MATSLQILEGSCYISHKLPLLLVPSASAQQQVLSPPSACRAFAECAPVSQCLSYTGPPELGVEARQDLTGAEKQEMITLFGLLAVSLLIQPRRLLAITAPGTQLAYRQLSLGSGLFLLRGFSFPRLCSTSVLLKFIKLLLLSFCSSILSRPPGCQSCLPATKCSPHFGVLLMRKN